jgi:hypothetical protein
MHASTGRMASVTRHRHHRGWARVFVFRWTVEIWVGDRWFMIGR